MQRDADAFIDAIVLRRILAPTPWTLLLQR